MATGVVALLGKNVYRAYAGLSRSTRVEWGRQMESMVDGVIDFVAPNPSARSTIPYEQRLAVFRAMRTVLVRVLLPDVFPNRKQELRRIS